MSCLIVGESQQQEYSAFYFPISSVSLQKIKKLDGSQFSSDCVELEEKIAVAA
jgi:hypothetical protein